MVYNNRTHVMEALLWLVPQDHTHACILSDSMCILQKVQAGIIHQQQEELILKSRSRKIIHLCAVMLMQMGMNERICVCVCGSTATTADCKWMNHPDFLTALKDHVRLTDLNMCKTQPLKRMHKMQIKICAAHSRRKYI